jgi:hypothetical protein
VAPLPRDETFERICELAADVVTWECSEWPQTDGAQVDVEFHRYVRPAWLAFTDEVEFELEGLDRADQEDCDSYWTCGRSHTREELLEMGSGEKKFSAFDKRK